MQEVYIYGLYNPTTNELRYIGKTISSLSERLKRHLKEKTDFYKNRWIRSLTAKNITPEIRLIEIVEFPFWKVAERNWIAYCKSIGIKLTNTTPGGDGIGFNSPQRRKQLSYEMKQKWLNPDIREKFLSKERAIKISQALTGRKHSPEHVAKLPQNKPGRKLSDATKQKMRDASHHRIPSAEEREASRKRSTGNKYGLGNKSRTGQVQSAEERKKKSIANLGKKDSEECKRKKSIAKAQYWKTLRFAMDVYNGFMDFLTANNSGTGEDNEKNKFTSLNHFRSASRPN